MHHPEQDTPPGTSLSGQFLNSIQQVFGNWLVNGEQGNNSLLLIGKRATGRE
jgi:hypothetical protein